MCRKFHGAAFATYTGAAPADFHWRQGEEKVVHYRSSQNGWRNFCPRCGSAVPASPEGGPFAAVPLGNVAEDPGIRPSAHWFVGSKAPWHHIPDDLRDTTYIRPSSDPTLSPSNVPAAVRRHPARPAEAACAGA